MTVTGEFRFRAASAGGELHRGVLSATSREHAADLLTARGLFPVEIRSRSALRLARGNASAEDIAQGLRVLAALLRSGLPVSRALEALGDLAPASWKPSVGPLVAEVGGGSVLSAALRSAPMRFPPIVIGVVEAAEGAGDLAAGLERAGRIVEDQARTRSALWTALAYPMVLCLAGGASIAVLAGAVLPRFASILQDYGTSLPASTRLVLSTAAFVRGSAAPALVILLVSVLAWRIRMSSAVGRRWWHGILVRLPVIGPLRLALASSRACAALAALLESGLPLSAALARAAPAVGDECISARLLEARRLVMQGSRLSEALADGPALSKSALRFVRAGEETGKLVEMLTRAAALESEWVERRAQRGVRLIEPGLILFFGGLVGLIAASLFQAVYALRPGS